MRLSDHFDSDEFACHHCGEVQVNPKLIELLEQLRYNIGGYPLTINSGYRCPTHNRNVGGVSNSQHVLGNAADVACPKELDFDEFLWYAKQIEFDAIGIYRDSNFLHLDSRNGGISKSEDDKIYWEG